MSRTTEPEQLHPAMMTRRRALCVATIGTMGLPGTARANEPGVLQGRLGARLDRLLADGRLDGVHGVVIRQRGETLLERYMPGEDEVWGQPLGRVAFGPDTLHDMRSVTKSIVSVLYGIALARGRVPPPEAPLLAQFPAYADLASDPRRARWTVAHALAMTLGTEWNENVPYISTANSELAMEMAPDRLRFVLERPLVAEPGTRWIYKGGASALLGALIVHGSGQPLTDFARTVLFDPLGIGAIEWAQGRDGAHSAASGLRMRPRDMAAMGEMLLAGGRHGGTQIVPADWIARSMACAATMPDGGCFGWQWYSGRTTPGDTTPRAVAWHLANGNGGQRLWLLPELQALLAVTAGNYNRPGQSRPPAAILNEVVLPVLAG